MGQSSQEYFVPFFMHVFEKFAQSVRRIAKFLSHTIENRMKKGKTHEII
ncbi:MAG: hypothetical protein ACI4DK_16865 [Lachnospiraceae bacterium]